MYYGGYHGTHNRTPMLLFFGIIGIAFGLLFFIQKFNLVSISFDISDVIYLYFFAGFTLLGGVIILFKALGLDNFMGYHR